ncbi:MAG: hypothetical protein O9274_12820 [Limnobacter sp.]|uniref:hypothetical protein n=1 Tax=Limnobacter sp. TaxID=2003368 RepID=UPI0022C881CE|nr:hypothetical protein [Limnobacter sp.]MCZ8016578.1 hypothetical protein [Limnobacter sp.]
MAVQCAGVGQLQRLGFAFQVVFVECVGLGVHAACRDENMASGSMRERAGGVEIWLVDGVPRGIIAVQIERRSSL